MKIVAEHIVNALMDVDVFLNRQRATYELKLVYELHDGTYVLPFTNSKGTRYSILSPETFIAWQDNKLHLTSTVLV